ncbi:hypothetical protein MMC29_006790, partial [Sticta canariensis]|nr:hypothetical protein [Sticta canariensis]
MFSSAFKIKSSVVTATAFIASVSLVLGRPQDRRLQARDWTDGFNLNLDGNSNAFSLPSPSEFLPSSPDGSSPPLIDFPNLGFVAPETLSAVPQAPEIIDSFAPLELSTDWTKTLSLPVDGTFDVAKTLPSVEAPPPLPSVISGSAMVLATEAVERSVNSISNGQFAYGFFEVSSDRKSLVPTLLSNEKDWDRFTQAVRNAPPSYVLHSTRDGMLLIFTHQNNKNVLKDAPSLLLDDNFKDMLLFVQKTCGKNVDARQVYNENSLEDAISPYQKSSKPVFDP